MRIPRTDGEESRQRLLQAAVEPLHLLDRSRPAELEARADRHQAERQRRQEEQRPRWDGPHRQEARSKEERRQRHDPAATEALRVARDTLIRARADVAVVKRAPRIPAP